MTDPMRAARADDARSAEEKNKKRKITGILFAGVLLLGALLPPRYKALSPLLFLLSPLFDVLSKLRGDSLQTEGSQGDSTPSDSIPEPRQSREPYSYTPRDPKDPRKYKPIG